MDTIVLKAYILLVAILGQLNSFATGSFDFNRKIFGVSYSPYVMKSEGEMPAPTASSYTFDIIQTQLEILSKKFSRIITWSVDSYDVLYANNFTYYYSQSLVRSRTAEAAALLNKKINKLSVTVTIGIWDSNWDNSRKMRAEVNVALQAAQIANSIYPDTVEGLLLANYDTNSLKWANSALRLVRDLRKMTPNKSLKLGTRQYCGDLPISEPANETQKEIWRVRKTIIQQSDFIICRFVPPKTNARQGAKYSVENFSNEITQYRLTIKAFNNEIQVMWNTEWVSGGNESWQNLDDFGVYWTEMNKLASNNNFTVWMESAFDFRYMSNENFGWWRLTLNALVNNATGYVEKVSAKSTTRAHQTIINITKTQTTIPTTIAATLPSTTSRSIDVDVDDVTLNDTTKEEPTENWRLEHAVIIVLSVGFLTILVYLIWLKCGGKKRFPVLSKRDIDEFKYGLLDDDKTQDAYNDGALNIPALKQPYNSCLEIAKSRLEILYNQVLGGGQFGCVYKAILRTGITEKEVAVKMTRHDCLDIAVKGILSEIKTMTYLGNHPNIVSIVGAYTAEIGNGVVYLVLELCSFGSLRNYVRNFRSHDKASRNPFTSGIPLGDMIRWSHEIACGLQYLEEKNVIHADIATRNVLLNLKNIAKITDFGLARRLHEYSVYTKSQQEPLPWRWMAIESLKKTEFSVKSDVWSYGVTLWEIFSLGALPFPGRSWNEDFIEKLEHESLRLGRPTHATDEMYKLMQKCWELMPENRPSFAELRAETKFIHDEEEKHEASMAKRTGGANLIM